MKKSKEFFFSISLALLLSLLFTQPAKKEAQGNELPVLAMSTCAAAESDAFLATDDAGQTIFLVEIVVEKNLSMG